MIWLELQKETFLAFFLVVAIGQICPQISANLKKLTKHIESKKNKLNLQSTYQERRRDGPDDVLATLKLRWCQFPLQ